MRAAQPEFEAMLRTTGGPVGTRCGGPAVPEGRAENSPPIYRWESVACAKTSPVGTTEFNAASSTVPTGLGTTRRATPSDESLGYSHLVPTAQPMPTLINNPHQRSGRVEDQGVADHARLALFGARLDLA